MDLNQLRTDLNLALVRQGVASADVSAARVALFIEERKALLVGEMFGNDKHELSDVPADGVDGQRLRAGDADQGKIGDTFEVREGALGEFIQRLGDVLRDLAEFIDSCFFESHDRNLSPTAVKQEGGA